MEERRVRIVDIADELGLSTATVSNVIHGKTKKISAETVKRVQELLEKRNYIPSMAGILLAQNNSHLIGVVVNENSKYEGRVLTDPFVTNSLDCLQREISGHGYYMMLRCTTQVEEIVRYASMWNMVGLVLLGFCGEDYEKLRDSMHIPFVVYDGFYEDNRTSEGNFANIAVDNINGGYQMGKYLVFRGYKKILYLADNEVCMDMERFQGLVMALKEEKLLPEDYRIHRIPMSKKERMQHYKKHLGLYRSYRAVFAASDVYAIELMNFLQDEGIRVPQEIAVAGFDDIPECQLVRPNLTTIRQDGEQRAKKALEMLLWQREHKERLAQKEVVPVTLVARGSA